MGDIGYNFPSCIPGRRSRHHIKQSNYLGIWFISINDYKGNKQVNMDKDKKWVLIIGAILLILLSSPNGEPEKKEGATGISLTIIGVVMMIGGVFLGPVAIPVIISGGVMSALGLGTAFAPKPTIPSWIWIAGFIILFFMLTLKKKGRQ